MPGKLVRIRRETKNASWYNYVGSNCDPLSRANYFANNQKAGDCDEYPFGSSLEGGQVGDLLLKLLGKPGVSLRLLDPSQNKSAGGSLGEFYKKCGVERGLFFYVKTSKNGSSEGHYIDNGEKCY